MSTKAFNQKVIVAIACKERSSHNFGFLAALLRNNQAGLNVVNELHAYTKSLETKVDEYEGVFDEQGRDHEKVCAREMGGEDKTGAQ